MLTVCVNFTYPMTSNISNWIHTGQANVCHKHLSIESINVSIEREGVNSTQ